jgi:hypothetical protein
MDPIHKLDPRFGGFFTRNFTDDPRYPPGSYYESMGWHDYGHTTNIYGPDGALLDQRNPGSVGIAARNIVLDTWRNR